MVFASWCGKKMKKATIQNGQMDWDRVGLSAHDYIFEIKSMHTIPQLGSPTAALNDAASLQLYAHLKAVALR